MPSEDLWNGEESIHGKRYTVRLYNKIRKGIDRIILTMNNNVDSMSNNYDIKDYT